MTNAEKYLKDGTMAKKLWKKFQEYYYKNKSIESDVEKVFIEFFEQEAKPTLTEDERVILRNIDKKYKYISRSCGTELYLKNEADDNCRYIFRGFCQLFQFIKEGEEYSIKELLEEK